MFLLLHLPLKAVWYPVLLCLVLMGGFFSWDFHGQLRRHRSLARLRELPGTLMAQSLEMPESWLEEEYQTLLRQILQEMERMQTEMDSRYGDMMDYYTIWAHQIKTPISSMHLALQQEDSPLARQAGEDLSRISQYVEMVLAYLRLDVRDSDYVIREYDLHAIISQTVRKLSGQFIRRKLRLEYVPVEETVVTDEKWLSFVLEQVLTNALKYTPSGTISIYMEETGILCVRDTGIGIAPEDLPRIFEKGYTGYNGRRDKAASGIGLYLCRRIMGNLGFSISAESQVDVGTTIRLDLRQKRVEQE